MWAESVISAQTRRAGLHKQSPGPFGWATRRDVWTHSYSLTFRDSAASTAHWILICPSGGGDRDKFAASSYCTANFEPYDVDFGPRPCLMDRIDIWRCKISGERDRCVGAGLSPFNYSQAEQYCGTRMLLPSVEADLISTLYALTSCERGVDIATWLSARYHSLFVIHNFFLR